MYVIRGWYGTKETGTFRADAQSKTDALEKALQLKSQGVEHVVVDDDSGREFTLNEFAIFCAEDEDRHQRPSHRSSQTAANSDAN